MLKKLCCGIAQMWVIVESLQADRSEDSESEVDCRTDFMHVTGLRLYANADAFAGGASSLCNFFNCS